MRCTITLLVVVAACLAIIRLPNGVGSANAADVAPERVIPQRERYDNAVRDAERAYSDAVRAACERYLKDLTDAKSSAMRAQDLDRANRIAAEITRITEAKQSAAAPDQKPPKLLIKAARWGVDETWWDVTEKIRDSVKEGVLDTHATDLGDPAFGKRKTLILEGTLGGQPFALYAPAVDILAFKLGAFKPTQK